MARKQKKSVETSGKRKTAIARASVKAGQGRVRVNSEPIEILQPSLARRKAMEPLIIADAMNKKRVLVPTPMPIMKPVVGLGEKLPFFPINSEQLSLFETDNTLAGKESGFDYYKISPKRVISAIKKSL